MTTPPPADLDAFRQRVRAWMAEHAATYPADVIRTDTAAGTRLRCALWDAGMLGITLAPDYGGQGLTEGHQAVFNDEAARHGLELPNDPVTTGICAPTLLDFGTEDQKRHHVSRMIRGEEAWTQLLSEPGAGSDLAGLQTKAIRDGDEYVLTGQKVWTSGAAGSDFALCVARTDWDAPKHRGLSMFIVDLTAPGVTIRPLRQMTGDAHFSEVFLDDVRVPATGLVGAEHGGWAALLAMLTHERLALGAGTGAGGGSGRSWFGPYFGQARDLATSRGLAHDAGVRQDLARLYIAEHVLSFMGRKMRDELAAGIEVGAKGSLAKLATATLARQASDLLLALAGPGAVAWDPADADGGALAMQCNFSPMTAIAGGTSEIQRNTVGERVLGLPKEPQVDKGVPFRDVLQNPTPR